MSYLLDTCVISELFRPEPEPAVVDWVRSHAELDQHLSVLTLGEIRKGAEKLRPGVRRRRIEAWLDHDLPASPP